MYQIKVGDVLKTRDGREVRIVAIDVLGEYPICGIIKVSDNDEEAFQWTENGRFSLLNVEGPSVSDLILPAPKTKRVAPVLWKRRDGKWVIDTLPISKEIFFTTKEDCSPSGIWLENVAIEVPDED